MPKYYDFEVSLSDIQPRIWRRFLLRTTASFDLLHHAIQDAFGWQDYHLFEFRVPSTPPRSVAGIPHDEEYGPPTPDAKRVKLTSYFTGRTVVEWCEYEYDFGDGWSHEVKLMGLVTEKESFRRRLLAGERSGPREDSGGVPGYRRITEFLRTGIDADDDPDGLRAWVGGWQPEGFDCQQAKRTFDR